MNPARKITLKESFPRQATISRLRRGVATVWTLGFVGVLLACLVVVVEVSHLWLARAELENALEAAALAAAKDWAESSGDTPVDTELARDKAIEYAKANAVNGTGLIIDDNYDASAPNGNDLAAGNLIFGALTENPPHNFLADTEPDCDILLAYGVRAQADAVIQPWFSSLLGVPIGPFHVRAKATAIAGCTATTPRLVVVSDYSPPVP